MPTALRTTLPNSQFSFLPRVHASAFRVLSCIQCVSGVGKWGKNVHVFVASVDVFFFVPFASAHWLWCCIVTCPLALAHRLDATSKHVSCTCPPAWCYVVTCLLHLHPGLMLRRSMPLALAHRLDATLSHVSCTCPPAWCYVVTCLLHLPTGLMLRCNTSLALAHRLDATSSHVSCTCPPAWC